VPDAQSLVSQMRSGQLDVLLGASYRDMETLSKGGNFEAVPFEGSERQFYIGTNVESSAMKDVRLREAIAYAIDRERIVNDVFRGVGYPIVLPWPSYSPAYDESANDTFKQDLDKARALVEEVGNVPTLPLEYSTANPNYEAIAQIVQSDLAAVGIKTELQPNEHAEHIEKLIGAKFEALWILDHAYAQYTPSTLAVTAYPFNADHNSSNFVSDDYKEHANAAWELPDGNSKDAVAAYADINKDLLENLFLIESNITYMQAELSADVEGFAWTKRSEPLLRGVWLDR
jgi:peptide/nickel transport system substrate-binding protein